MAEDEAVVVVTGAAGALGAATAELFHARGWRVVGVDRERNRERIPAVATPLGCDLTRTDEVAGIAAAAAALGSWRALAVCSGGFAAGAAADTADELLASQLDANLVGPWKAARAAAQVMRGHGAGRIVLTLSRASTSVDAGAAAYQVTKAAAARLVQLMAVELRGSGVTVNGVMPSILDTPANRAAMGEERAATRVPPERVAAAIVWLCGEDAADVSGALLPVYGAA